MNILRLFFLAGVLAFLHAPAALAAPDGADGPIGPTPTATISASPTTINYGQTTTITWSSTLASSCDGTGFSTGGARSGSVTVTPSFTTTYYVDCVRSQNGATGGDSVRVTVITPPPSVSLTASEDLVDVGDSATLSWTCTYSPSASLTANGIYVGNYPASGSTSVSPSRNTTYTITCQGGSSTPSASTEVDINGSGASLSSSPSLIQPGASASLTYRCTSSSSGSISGYGNITADGNAHTVSVSPSVTTTYKLTCTNANGADIAEANVNVNSTASLAVECSVSPTSISTGQNATWTATPSGGSSIQYVWQSTTENGESEEVCSHSTQHFLPSCDGKPKIGSMCGGTGWEGSTCYVLTPGRPKCTSDIVAQFRSVRGYYCGPQGGFPPTYTYSWSGTDGLTGTAQSIPKIYTIPGLKTGTVTLYDGSGSHVSDSCTLSVGGGSPIKGACSPSATSATTGQAITWSTSGVSGGTGSYTYSWSGTDGLSGSGASVSKTYSTAGTKTASVTISSPSSSPVTINCSSPVTVSAPVVPVTGSCSVSPSSAAPGASVTWTATASGGSGTGYTYAWSGTNLTGKTGASVTVSYSSAGTYSGSIVITDSAGKKSGTIACSNSANITAPNPVATLTCPATPIDYNTAATLTWDCANSTSAAIDNGIGSVTPVAHGTVSTGNLTTTTKYTLTCTGPVGTTAQTSSCNVAVGAGLPNLTASLNSVPSGTVGTPVMLTGTIRNIGPASTGSGFTDLFEINKDSPPSDFASIDAVRSYSSSALGAGANDAGVKASYTFPSAGTWYVRLCADLNTSGAGSITESQEGDNCDGASSGWTEVTVTGSSSLSCTVSDTSVDAGGSVTYTAHDGSSPYIWTPSDGVGSYGSGSTANRAFSAGDAGKSFGMTVTSGAATKNCPAVTVTASAGNCGLPAGGGIDANPTRIKQGGKTHLTWSAEGIEDGKVCTITDGTGDTFWSHTTDSSCNVSDEGGTDVTLDHQTTFTLTCGGIVIDTVTVDVVPNFGET